jgi:glucokinase
MHGVSRNQEDSVSAALENELAERTIPLSGPPVVLGDIGGTTARFALLTGGELSPIEHLSDADYPCFADVLRQFLCQRNALSNLGRAQLAVAGPVDGERCTLVNHHWIIDSAELRKSFGFSDIRLFNDFEATAWSLPRLTAGDLLTVGGGQTMRNAPMVVIGPGTGLGVAAFIPDAQNPRVIASEGGHSTVPGCSLREDAVVQLLRRLFGHVSSERALSGGGIENLYCALAKLDGTPAPHRTAAEITEAALDGRCVASRAAVDMFCAMLGTVAGNIALSFGARGGVYIAGGIVPRISAFLTQSSFRERFEAKGRFSGYMKSIPTYVILRPDVAFLGLQTLALRSC